MNNEQACRATTKQCGTYKYFPLEQRICESSYGDPATIHFDNSPTSCFRQRGGLDKIWGTKDGCYNYEPVAE